MTAKLSSAMVGHVSERLVDAYAVVGSGGRLSSAKPKPDVDSKDFIFDEVGGFRSFYVQVKAASHLDARGLVRCVAKSRDGQFPSNDRLVYVVCLLDLRRIQIAAAWVIPSRDFNRLANRSHGDGRATLLFESTIGGSRGGGKWARFRVEPVDLGKRLYDYLKSARADVQLDIDGLRLYARKAA